MNGSWISTDFNDFAVARAYRQYLASASLGLYAVLQDFSVSESPDLLSLTGGGAVWVRSTQAPAISQPISRTIAGRGTVWGFNLSNWPVRDLLNQSRQIYGMAVVDESFIDNTGAQSFKVLYLQKFESPLPLAVDATLTFSVELFFDTALKP